MTNPVFRFLPLILVVILLGGALIFLQQRDALKKRMDDLLARANKVATTKLPSPTPFVTKTNDSGFKLPDTTPTPTVTPKATVTPTPTVTPKATVTPTPTKEEDKTSKGGVATTNTKTRVVCTPVYGMGNQCVEHIVVDTAVDTSVFYNLAALSYLGGLAAFIKAKRS